MLELSTMQYAQLPWKYAIASVRKTFEWKRWHLDVYVDVQNVYNRRVPEPTISGINEKGSVYAFGLPILPIFGIDAIIWP